MENNKGFSIIELMFAIVILASGLTVLLGLQSSSTAVSLRDRNQQQAMLIARSIMSGIENETSISDSKINGNIEKLFDKYKLVMSQSSDFEEIVSRMTANLEIQSVEVPIVSKQPIPPLKMFKIDLNLNWGKSVDDNLNIIYFVNR